jgi:drug/metabolite transporter (DMT)-like permease
MKNINKWFWLGLMATIIGSPNGTIIKITVADLDPSYFNFLRFGLIFIVTLPYLILKIKRINKSGFKYAVLAGITLSIAVTVWVEAIKLSNASYASLITLVTPVFFISYSVKLNNESISKKSAAGITLAALGAFVMIFLPIAAKGGVLGGQFYPLATLLLLSNSASYPLATIAVKKSNDSGVPMASIISVSSLVIFIINGAMMLINKPVSTSIDGGAVTAVLFSGLAVGVIHRMAAIKSYEHIGSVASSALSYFGSFLSILIPVFVLGEQLSLSMVAGGVLILLGIYIIEHHKSEHHKHFHVFRHH